MTSRFVRTRRLARGLVAPGRRGGRLVRAPERLGSRGRDRVDCCAAKGAPERPHLPRSARPPRGRAIRRVHLGRGGRPVAALSRPRAVELRAGAARTGTARTRVRPWSCPPGTVATATRVRPSFHARPQRPDRPLPWSGASRAAHLTTRRVLPRLRTGRRPVRDLPRRRRPARVPAASTPERRTLRLDDARAVPDDNALPPRPPRHPRRCLPRHAVAQRPLRTGVQPQTRQRDTSSATASRVA